MCFNIHLTIDYHLSSGFFSVQLNIRVRNCGNWTTSYLGSMSAGKLALLLTGFPRCHGSMTAKWTSGAELIVLFSDWKHKKMWITEWLIQTLQLTFSSLSSFWHTAEKPQDLFIRALFCSLIIFILQNKGIQIKKLSWSKSQLCIMCSPASTASSTLSLCRILQT